MGQEAQTQQNTCKVRVRVIVRVTDRIGVAVRVLGLRIGLEG